METLKFEELNLVLINEDELENIDGGLVLLGGIAMLNKFMDEMRQGIRDGWNDGHN